MRIIQVVAVAFLFLFSTSTWGADGLIAIKSPHSSKATMDRLENLAKQQGMMIFARIDHAAAAAKIGKKLRSTELLIFGNPLGGTPFMECNQTVGIDLPLKALVWEDASGAGVARLQRSGVHNDTPWGVTVSRCGKHEKGNGRPCSNNCIFSMTRGCWLSDVLTKPALSEDTKEVGHVALDRA